MQSMREMLRSNLGRSLRPLPPLDRLLAAWPVACGSALAARGELVAFEDGVLSIVIADPAWMESFGHMKAILQSDMSRISGLKVREIHFQKAGPQRPEPRSNGQ